ncbi:MAG TPA: oxidative damage protection protein [bacterium]
MAKIKCARCGTDKEGLDERPYQNELGDKILATTCPDCWQAWVSQQLMLMNEYRLDPLNDEHSAFLDREMLKFLSLS